MRRLSSLLITLLIFSASACSAAQGNITLRLDDVEGIEGLTVESAMIPLPMTQELWEQAVPRTNFPEITDDPFSGTQPYENEDEGVTEFESGTHRLIIEVYESNGPMYFGCEMLIEVDEAEDLEVTIASLPTYTGDGMHWTQYSQLQYPKCPPG